ncbi:MAG: DUF4124 domain-containing protein [Gammaproteobacteria bacterium]|nr:DUF4124 domain-containing protein [Xanthomonadales bacterium]
MTKLFLLVLMFSSTTFVYAQIYKYVDENGQVHYTDKDPELNKSKADAVKSLTIIEKDELEPNSSWKRYEHKKKQASNQFEEFNIVSPKPDTRITSANGNILASVHVDGNLPSKYRIKFYLDGVARGKVRSNSQLIADVGDGEHTLYAELIESHSRKVMIKSPEIKFEYSRSATRLEN